MESQRYFKAVKAPWQGKFILQRWCYALEMQLLQIRVRQEAIFEKCLMTGSVRTSRWSFANMVAGESSMISVYTASWEQGVASICIGIDLIVDDFSLQSIVRF